jgi:uridylate kinase
MKTARLKYRRILLKLSGTAFAGKNGFGIDPVAIRKLAELIKGVRHLGVEIAIVNGGGNLFRGRQAAGTTMRQLYADSIGMLGTAMNALALQDFLEQLRVPAVVFSTLELSGVIEPYVIKKARADLSAGRVVLISGGTGHPFFTTDTAAVLRALEVGAEVVLKATDVDGVYDSNPWKNPHAKKYETVTYREAIEKDLAIMDQTAFALARETKIPTIVFNFSKEGALAKIVKGEKVGTLVKE